MNRFDIAEAYKWWDVLRDGNQLTEIRLLANDGRTASGIFDNIDEIVKAIVPYTNDWNIYYTINRLPDDVRGLPQYNKIIVRPKQTCNDNMMIARDYVCIDLDSRRLSGTNATDEQVEFTKKKANEVYQYLVNVGFNPPTVVFSSSGVHLYLKCAMQNNEKNTKLVKRFLQALSMMFTDEHTDVDEKVFNCARIMRLPSTYSCKGNTMDASRPQRLCKFVKISDNKVNDIAYFEKVAALYPEEEARPSSQNNYSMESFDLDAFIEKHHIPVTKKVEVADGTRYYLEHCLFNDQHKGKDAILFKHNNGAVAYFCYHNSCQGNDWHKVREMYEPDAYKKKPREFHRRFNPYKREQIEYIPQEEEDNKGNVWQTFDEIEDEDRSQIVTIPSGITKYDEECCGFDKPSVSVWSGNNGSAKSTLLNQLAINAVNQGFKVAIYSGELRGKKLKRWIIMQAAGKTYNKKSQYNDYDYYTPNNVKEKIVDWLKDKLYNYNTRYSSNIEQVCVEIEKIVKEKGIDMILIDNLSCLDIDTLDGAINEQQKSAIKMIIRLTNNLNIATHLIIHPKKSYGGYLRKEDVSGVKTLTDLADNVFFVHRWNQDTQRAAKDFMPKSVYDDIEISRATNIVEVIKMREFGEAEGHIYKLFYESESRRLKNSIAETIHYGWEEEPVQTDLNYMSSSNDEYEDVGDMPDFEEYGGNF